MHRDVRVEDLLNSAERLTRAGRYGRAVHFYRRVLRISPEGDFARELSHARLGDLHLGLGRADLAVPHLARAHRLSGGDPEYALMLGRALRAVGDGDAASAALFEALESAHHAGDALSELAGNLAPVDRRAAARLARRAAGIDPRHRALARSLADA